MEQTSIEEIKINLIKAATKLVKNLKEQNLKYPDEHCIERDEMIEKLELGLEIFHQLE